MRTFRHLFLWCASAALMVAGCRDVPTESSEFVDTDDVASSVVCSGPVTTNYMNPWGNLNCNTVIRIKPVGTGWQPNERDEVEQAAVIVGGVLDGAHDLPTVVYSEGTSNPLVEVEITGSGSLYWGEYHTGTPGSITIHRSADPYPSPGVEGRTVNLSAMHGVVLHEILNLFGFKEKNNPPGVAFPKLEDAGCAIEVPELPLPFPTSMCLYEEQSLFYSFGLRSTDVDLESDLYTGIDLNVSSLTLEPSEQAILETFIMTTGGGGANPNLVMSASTNGTAAVVIPRVVSWDEDPTGIVTFLSRTDEGATIQASASPGTGTVTASLDAGPQVVWPEPSADVDISVSEPCDVAFSPTSADIEIGEIEIFAATPFCPGITASLAPANGTAGFSSGTACTLTSVSSQGLVKVRGCQEGSATLTIRQDGVVVQTINIDVVPPPPPVVTSVTISPSSAVLGVAGTFFASGPNITMQATARDAAGNVMPGVNFFWSSSTSYATPSPTTGQSTLIVGCSPYPTYAFGTITATATGTSVQGTASVQVNKNHPTTCGVEF